MNIQTNHKLANESAVTMCIHMHIFMYQKCTYAYECIYKYIHVYGYMYLYNYM